VSPIYTADGIWQVGFDAPHEAVPCLLERLDDLALSVSVAEDGGDGGDPAPTWRVELLVAGRPDITRLSEALRERCAGCGLEPGEIRAEPLPPTDWLRAVAEQARPFRVGRFLIHSSAARGSGGPGLVPIEIDAGLAFGSGEHDTTRGCLEAIDRMLIRRRPRRILDLGCGSAILAIAAAKRWPTARLLAVDNDPVAVRVAGENVRLNRVAARVTVAVGHGVPAGRRFDLILANILADPLTAMAAAIERRLKPGGRVVLAGLLDRQAPTVTDAYRRCGLRLLERRDLGAWSILTLARPRSRAGSGL
jgi:ribosomal protein L11 methyltransferase